MRYVIQLIRWLLRFNDKASEDRVDAYSAQSAFFIIMGFIPFVMLLLILLQYTPMKKEDVMTLLRGRFSFIPVCTGWLSIYQINRPAFRNSDHSRLGMQ